MKEQLPLSKIYETVLSVPGMNEPVKLALSLSRKQIFFLNKIVERGLAERPADDNGGFVSMPEGMSEEILLFANDLLVKAGLKDMNEKLKGL